jgi:DNA-binding transcriptional ArsR family regulator
VAETALPHPGDEAQVADAMQGVGRRMACRALTHRGRRGKIAELFNSAILHRGAPVNEIIVRIARAIACLARLRILSRLARVGEMSPTELARQLGMSPDLVCSHLRRLSAAGLILRRRSSVWRYCKAESPYSQEALSGKVTSWLCEVLGKPRRAARSCGVAQRRSSSDAASERQLHGILFDAATAFTSVRRLQILRRLADGDAVDLRTLARELSMSDSAVSRHTAKLRRRGYLVASRAGRDLAFRVASQSRTPVHAGLFEIICAAWERRESQS